MSVTTGRSKPRRWIVRKRDGHYYVDCFVNLPMELLKPLLNLTNRLSVLAYEKGYKKLHPLLDAYFFVMGNTWFKTRWFREGVDVGAEAYGLLDRLERILSEVERCQSR